MNFGGVGEMAFILMLALLLFGPKKLPEIARQVGKVLAEFRKASAEFQAQLNEEVRQLEVDVNATHTIAPPEKLSGTAARGDLPSYAQEPNSGQHSGEAPVENGSGDRALSAPGENLQDFTASAESKTSQPSATSTEARVEEAHGS